MFIESHFSAQNHEDTASELTFVVASLLFSKEFCIKEAEFQTADSCTHAQQLINRHRKQNHEELLALKHSDCMNS